MNNIIKLPLLILILSLSKNSSSQDHILLPQIERYYPTDYYTTLSFGLTNPIYRDFATSPLFYNGIGLESSSASLKRSDARERIFEFGFGISAQLARVPQSNYIQSGSISGYGKFDIYYQQSWTLEALSDAKNNTKIGGAINITQNIRANPGLQNNAIGLENISNLMASAQWTRDISRTEVKQLNLWLFKPTLKPVKRELRFLLNVGMLNFNYRPGYAYSYDSELNGMDTSPIQWALSNYKWSLNGWRLKTELEFLKYLSNGNVKGWSYVWEAAHAPGKFEAFQMASHQLKYTFYIHSEKR